MCFDHPTWQERFLLRSKLAVIRYKWVRLKLRFVDDWWMSPKCGSLHNLVKFYVGKGFEKAAFFISSFFKAFVAFLININSSEIRIFNNKNTVALGVQENAILFLLPERTEDSTQHFVILNSSLRAHKTSDCRDLPAIGLPYVTRSVVNSQTVCWLLAIVLQINSRPADFRCRPGIVNQPPICPVAFLNRLMRWHSVKKYQNILFCRNAMRPNGTTGSRIERS